MARCTRICIWKSGIKSIQAARKSISTTAGDIPVFSTRRTKQLNDIWRIETWTPSEDADLLIGILESTNPEWVIKRHQPYTERHTNPQRRKQKRQSKFKLISWNVQGINKKLNLAKHYLSTHDPDIVLLQETRIKENKRPLNSASHDAIYCHEKPGVTSARGLALIFKRAEVKVERIDCKEAEDWMIAAKLDTKSTKLTFIGVHLHHDPSTRKKQLPIIQRMAFQLRELHEDRDLIITGDFNMSCSAIDKELLCAHEIERTGCKRVGLEEDNTPTWRKIENGAISRTSHIDHFLSSRNPELPQSLFIDKDCEISDHSPIVLSWKIEEQANATSKRMDHAKIIENSHSIRTHNAFTPIAEMEGVEEIALALAEASWKAATEASCVKGPTQGNPKTKSIKTSKNSKKALRTRTDALQLWKSNPSPEHLLKLQTAQKEADKALREDARLSRDNFKIKLTDSLTTGEEVEETWRSVKRAVGMERTRHEITALKDPTTGILHDTKEGITLALHHHYEALFADPENTRAIDWNQVEVEWLEGELPHINDPPTWPEINLALRKIGRKKSPGPDGVVSEIYKSAITAKGIDEPTCPLGHAILHLIKKVFEEETFAKCWDASILISLPKKPGSTNTGDYRGISLIDTISKLITSILAKRILQGAIETGRICPEQAGFRSNEEAIAQATLVYEVLTRQKIRGETSYCVFIDAEKAFDRAPHGAILRKAEAFGVRGKALNLIKNLYEGASFITRHQDCLSEPGKVLKGVKQGDPLSPILFCIFMNDMCKALQELNPNDAPRLNHTTPRIHAGKFADDVVTIATSRDAALLHNTATTNWMNKWKMNANAAKCALMIVRPKGDEELQDEDPTQWELQGKTIPITKEYVYLGVKLNDSLNLIDMGSSRLDKAENFKKCCYPLFWSKSFPIAAKLLILNSILIPIMTYGAEVWGWCNENEGRMNKLIGDCIRAITGASSKANTTYAMLMLRVDTARALIFKRSLGLYSRATKSNTHFKDLTEPTNLPLGSITWTSRCDKAKSYLTAIESSTLNENIKPPYLSDCPSYKDLITKADFIDHLGARSKTKTLTRIQKSRTMEWNHLYLEAQRCYPHLSKGSTLLLKIRISDLFCAKRLFHILEGKPTSWTKSCPSCELNTPEDIPHYLFTCTRWAEIRQETLGDTTIPPDERAGFEMALGIPSTSPQSYLTSLKLHQPDTLTENIIKVTTFLERTHHARRKILDSTPDTQVTSRQPKITAFFQPE